MSKLDNYIQDKGKQLENLCTARRIRENISLTMSMSDNELRAYNSRNRDTGTDQSMKVLDKLVYIENRFRDYKDTKGAQKVMCLIESIL